MPSTRQARAGREKAGGRARGAIDPAPRDSQDSPTRGKRRYKKPVRGDTWKEPFLVAFRKHGTISAAAREAGVDRRTVFNARQRDEDFALAFADADEHVTERLEEAALRRAIRGSDRLTEFLLKARRPERYSETHRVLHSGTITSRSEMTPEQQEEELAGFGLVGAAAVAQGPEAVEPPEDA